MTHQESPPATCDAYDADECRMIRERSVAGVSDVIPPCAVHAAPLRVCPNCGGDAYDCRSIGCPDADDARAVFVLSNRGALPHLPYCSRCIATMHDVAGAIASVVARDDSAECVECGYQR